VITSGENTVPLRAASSVGELVDQIAVRLSGLSIDNAAAEARDIVAAAAGENRFWPRLHADAELTSQLAARADAIATSRARGMPFAYAVGRAAFRHLTLTVNQSVLIPRQETEVLVDLVLGRFSRPGGTVADVGTGSGAIALALASEGQFERVIGTDISADAISIAHSNAQNLAARLKARMEFRTGDLLLPLAGERLDVLVSNPPYIAFDEASDLPASVRDWEPSHALFSGGHGLNATRRIIEGAPALLSSGGLLALEVDYRRALQVAELVASNGSFRGIEVCPDLVGRDRFVVATRT
jgi:release factor glutamine methyltransferase